MMSSDWNRLNLIGNFNAPINKCRIGRKSCNSRKNRYPDVYPFDDTLALATNPDVDTATRHSKYYINASYIKIANSVLIACQAPLPTCFDVFWEMVWVNNSRVIAMVTPYIERSCIKAHCYIPTKVGDTEEFGKVKVKLEETLKFNKSTKNP